MSIFLTWQEPLSFGRWLRAARRLPIGWRKPTATRSFWNRIGLPQPPQATGLTAIISGSCSSATCRQVEAFKRCGPALALEPAQCNEWIGCLCRIDWASDRIAGGPVLIYSTMTPANLREVQTEFGESAAAQAFERTMSDLAQGLVELGVRRLVIAGGETAGAVVQSLGVAGLSIGPEIEPGVPWTESLGEPSLALALKSGNFGSDDFFGKAPGDAAVNESCYEDESRNTAGSLFERLFVRNVG